MTPAELQRATARLQATRRLAPEEADRIGGAAGMAPEVLDRLGESFRAAYGARDTRYS